MSINGYIDMYTSFEICAGAGGQALGLESAGFEHAALVEIDTHACATLRLNRPNWNVIEGDLKDVNGYEFKGVDLFAGGVPCPPFSIAGKQLGRMDERDLFPDALRLIREIAPRAVMIENVKGILDKKFWAYRKHIQNELQLMGYSSDWKLLQSSDYGVPQLRPRAILVAMRDTAFSFFRWPDPVSGPVPTVGQTLYKEMAKNGWRGVDNWIKQADKIAPTLVGGSKKHGGADLGPTRARAKWSELGVDGRGLANDAPAPDWMGQPRLTVGMAALIQGFPPNWRFAGKKTASYRQIGNAFPPLVAKAVGQSIFTALQNYDTSQERGESQTA